MKRSIRRTRRSWRGYRNESGAAALEIALWSGLMVLPILSVVDIGFYLYQRMELENATQVAAQAVWTKCGTVYLPATTKCPGLNATINNAIQTSTTLATDITATATNEGYYCMVSGALQPTGGSLSSGTTICADGSRSADYIQITGSYTYTPLFQGVTVASLLTAGGPITKTVWMRLN